MVTEILIFALCIVCALGVCFIAWLNIKQFGVERKEWQEERSKLLDRIQSGSFTEYKAQERAATPVMRREKDPLLKSLESEPWL